MVKFFVTGTGTDVGKTYVSAGLAWQNCQQNKKNFVYIKPVASGVVSANSDIEAVRSSLHSFSNALVEGWYAYHEPASPYIAAKAENKNVPYEEILSRISKLNELENNYLMEGAGGVYVPLTKEKMVIDLIEDLNWPVIVVGHAGLGTVNHTCLTISALKERKCQIAGIILNQAYKGDSEEFKLAASTNKAEIERLTMTRVLGIVKYGDAFDGINFSNIWKNLTSL